MVSKQKQNKKEVVVIALGGNAMTKPGQAGTYEEQMENISVACDQILKIYQQNYSLVLSTGNGPQVGNINKQNAISKDKVPEMNLFTCGAMSQGQIGYWFQQTLGNKLRAAEEDANICTILTQTIVDQKDQAFQNPTKPVGQFFTEAEKDEILKQDPSKKMKYIEAQQKWRVVVPSPKPMKIVELPMIKELISNPKNLVVSTIGGGIPVLDNGKGQLVGVDAVIDKDLGNSLLATQLKADKLMILTDVSYAYINYKKENEQKLEVVKLSEMKKLMADGYFASGSMGPKVQAAINFVENGGKEAIITSLNEAADALQEKCGTRIIRD